MIFFCFLVRMFVHCASPVRALFARVASGLQVLLSDDEKRVVDSRDSLRKIYGQVCRIASTNLGRQFIHKAQSHLALDTYSQRRLFFGDSPVPPRARRPRFLQHTLVISVRSY